MIANIILGGHDTTKLGIANSLLALLSHPGEWATLCDDPSKTPAAVEEALRLNSSVVLGSRVVTLPFALDDVAFEEGERIVFSPLVANHDDVILVRKYGRRGRRGVRVFGSSGVRDRP